MRKSMLSAMGLALLWISSSCQHHDDPNVTGKVSLTVNQVATNNGRVTSLDHASKIVVTIEDGAGSKIFDLKELNLVNQNNEFVSEDLEIPAGNYQLTYFQVIDDQKNVIAATPIEGSQLASLVTHPLPIEFQIAQGQTNDLSVEVIETTETSPVDFGYATFGLTNKSLTALFLSMSHDGIDRIEYELTREGESIKATSDFANCILNFNNPEMLGKTYDVKLKLWFNAVNDFVKVYWYTGTISFNGDAIQLPSLTDAQWKGYYSSQINEFKMYWGLDPRMNEFKILIETELDQLEINGFIDRSFFTVDGDGIGGEADDGCDVFREIIPTGELTEVLFSKSCSVTTVDFDIECFAIIPLKGTGITRQGQFGWQVRDGVITAVKPF